MTRKGTAVGAIPGYGGHIPCMRNHLIGRSFTPASLRSATCAVHLRHNDYASALPLTVESRPQGRDFLYAQTAKIGDDVQEREAIMPRVSKRLPPLEMHHAAGVLDIRDVKIVVGSPEDCVTKTYKSNSIPELPYKNRMLQKHKHFESMELQSPEIKSIPGYTGHQHATQHIFSRSYGSMQREIINDNQSPGKATVQNLLYYDDPRPVGKILTEKHKMAGYQGYIPSKNNHIYGKSAGKASDLASIAEKCLKDRGNLNAMPEFVDNPPQGHVDLYAQALEHYHMDQISPLNLKVDKGRVQVNYLEKRPDHRLKERIEPDIEEVMQSKHHVQGYTGHVHALQHTYGRSYGKATRSLYGKPAMAETSEEFLGFTDKRPLMDQAGELIIS